VTNLEEAKKADLHRFRKFFQVMLAAGVYLPPSQFEALFLSLAHRPADLQAALTAAEQALAAV
ncbi:MAG TPA: aspartate aminotransferase family protein, partial [Desulfobaccales bacterium]